MKRAFDIVAALLGLLALAPLLLVVSLILLVTGEKKVFFFQERVGQFRKPFNLIKFTTMSDAALDRPDAGITLDDDPDVFPFGRVLRRTKINELPQLINVLKGDISLVGPRPLTPRSFARYPEQVQEQLAPLKPGLTGLASVIFRDEEKIIASSPKSREQCYMEDIRPRKAELEKIYGQNMSFWLDLKIVLATAVSVLAPSISVETTFFQGLLDRQPFGRDTRSS